jgi:hypothetical protein
MISRSVAVIGELTLLSTVAFAGLTPKELHGKSITVSWMETRTMRFESEQQVRNTGTYVQTNVYISTAGRPFVQVINNGLAGHNLHEQIGNLPTGREQTAPGEAGRDRVDFEGQSILVYQQFRSGARRISIDLDGTTCKATLVNGREGGKNIVVRGPTGHGPAEVLSVQVEAIRCSIREGNVFGHGVTLPRSFRNRRTSRRLCVALLGCPRDQRGGCRASETHGKAGRMFGSRGSMSSAGRSNVRPNGQARFSGNGPALGDTCTELRL